MQQVANLLPLLILITLIIASLWGGWNWRTHHERQHAAEKRNWRYQPGFVAAVLGRPFRVAGSTPSGAIWEMEPRKNNGRFTFHWHSKEAHLPYGKLIILPRDMAATTSLPEMHAHEVGSRHWQARFVTFVTHDQLAENFITTTLENDLKSWPDWPQPGALLKISITSTDLTIIAHQQSGWLGRDRLAALGDALTTTLAAK